METSIRIRFAFEGARLDVSGLLNLPGDALSCLVLAHGAGADMRHPFMAAVAQGLADRRIASLRYQFPYSENGSRRPDRPPLAHATVRAAVAAAQAHAAGMRLFAGGKSFGGRMTSQAQAIDPLQAVAGLVFLGFPLHPAGRPSPERADHLLDVDIPMLFVHGSRDALADPAIFRRSVGRLGPLRTVLEIADADHSFRVPRKSGRTEAGVLAEMLDTIAIWMQAWEL